MNIPDDMKIGLIYQSINYGEFKITKYINCDNVIIKFLVTGFELNTVSSSIRSGQVKDYIRPSVYGVGFYGVGEFFANTKGVPNKYYDLWHDMLRRCYDPARTKKNKCYEGVVVCNEWHNLQNFAKWFCENYPGDGKQYHLDKDLNQKKVNNKIYSPETCVFITPKENNVEAMAKYYEVTDPAGFRVKIYNMNEFCIGKPLTSSGMRRMYRGERNHYKGWTKAL